MKNIFSCLLLMGTLLVLLNSCSKVADSKDLSKAVVQIAAPISDAACLSGAIKGTMLAGKTYHVCGDIIINKGDTLTIQEGVKVLFEGSFGLGVKGSLISLGTKEKPNWFTYDSATLVRTDNIGADPTKDPALKGLWTGILGDTPKPPILCIFHVRPAYSCPAYLCRMLTSKVVIIFPQLPQCPNKIKMKRYKY